MSVAPSRRWLAAALVISAAAHGAGAWWLWGRPLALAGRVEAAGAGPPVEVQVIAAASRPEPRGGALRAPRPPAQASAPAAGMDPPLMDPPEAPAPAPAEEPPAPGGGGSAPVVPGPPAGGGVPSALVSRLAAAALGCYPAAAARFRLQGEVTLAFCLGEDGAARSAAMVRSSGSPLLDRAALECVLPGALPVPGAAGCYELPVRFARE